MKLVYGFAALLFGGLAAFMVFTAGWERPPMESVQTGYRGLALEQVTNPRTQAIVDARNQVPEPGYQPEPGGPLASEVYENVQVLGDLGEEQFNTLMANITQWVSPDEGCAYCHNEENLAEDSVYTKVVARRMFQMTAAINKNWQDHVSTTGVTCYTCHRGQPVPSEVWFRNPSPATAQGRLAYGTTGQNIGAMQVGYTSLPFDPFSDYLSGADPIRVISEHVLARPGGATIQQTEKTYALMMHFSGALGVNCTFCHNSRSFFAWDQSAPQRTTAWHGIQMIRDVNGQYVEPLTPVFPANRLGPRGDVAKVNCATCHQGVSKPLLGAQMLKDYPELNAAK